MSQNTKQVLNTVNKVSLCKVFIDIERFSDCIYVNQLSGLLNGMQQFPSLSTCDNIVRLTEGVHHKQFVRARKSGSA